MKKVLAMITAVSMALTIMSPSVFAAWGDGYDSYNSWYDSYDSRYDSYDSGVQGEIEIDATGGKEIELRGHIEPTIISVTMPSYIPFEISKGMPEENKVVSPKIGIQNNSNVPVEIFVDRARIDLENMQGVSWSDTGIVNDNQIAVGLTQAAHMPNNLAGAKWLANGKQKTDLLNIYPGQEDNLFIVGALGGAVPENRAFSVIPTLVVRQAA